jgi:PAS domain S-box-containing protein
MLLPIPGHSTQQPSSGKTIVIVEDERIAAEDVRRRLESWGYRVGAVVSSGEEAVQTAETSRPDLMLMDIKLKGKMDGVEAARRIRARTNIPVIYATAHADPATLQRAQVTEPFGLINKPYDDEQMRSAISMTLFKRSMERQMNEIEDRYRRLMALTSDLVFVVTERRVLTASASAIAALGYHPDDLLQKDVAQFVSPDSIGDLLSVLDEPGSAPPDSPLRLQLQTQSGSVLTVELTVANTRQNGDRVSMLLMKDISARVAVEEENARLLEELFESKGEAEESLRVIRFKHRELVQLREGLDKEQTAVGAERERRNKAVTPSLVALRGITAMLLESGLSDRQRRYVDEIRVALHDLEVVDIPAALENTESDRSFALRPRDTDVRETVLSLVDRFARVARDRGLALSTRVETDVPAVLRLDADRWTEVLTELVGNALRFTHQGEVTVSVQVEHEGTEGVVLRCDVTDSGEGIPDQKIPSLFQNTTGNDPVFLRTDAPRGVGLRFCRQVIEDMGGSIGVESELGRGSIFRCRIPCLIPATEVRERAHARTRPVLVESDASTSQTAVPASSSSVPAPGMRILVADDEEINRAIARRMLESFGCSVDIARDGFEAVEAVRAVPYDMVFLDVRMPGLDGFATAAAIRSMSLPVHGVRIIAMSADMQEADQRRCISAGMDDTIEKPLSVDLVNLLLRRWRR